jgi:uncharacterized membrane protein YjjP (DUF1212 family)
VSAFWHIWTDEKGNPSAARVLLTIVVLYTCAVIQQHLNGANVDAAVWIILTTFATYFTAWAGGNRLAQYLMPALGSVTASIGQALRRKEYGPSTEALDPHPAVP